MTPNKKKNTAVIISAIFLFLALIEGWPYGFFTLLRIIVFTASTYIAWMAYQERKEKWVWVFGLCAVLFNPVIVIRLTREIWSFIDIIVGVLMLLSIFVLKLKRQSGSS